MRERGEREEVMKEPMAVNAPPIEIWSFHGGQAYSITLRDGIRILVCVVDAAEVTTLEVVLMRQVGQHAWVVLDLPRMARLAAVGVLLNRRIVANFKIVFKNLDGGQMVQQHSHIQ